MPRLYDAGTTRKKHNIEKNLLFEDSETVNSTAAVVIL